MEKKIFLLELKENPRFVKIIQVIFGIFCLGISIYWILYYLKIHKADSGMWITFVFLSGFGAYQILAGLGRTSRYIETSSEFIKVKQNSFLPSIVLKPGDIEKIEIYPLSIAFYMKNRKKSVLRFGINYPEIIDPVKSEMEAFGNVNNIAVEYMKENI